MQIEYRLMDKIEKMNQGVKKKIVADIQKENPTTLTATQAVVLHYILIASQFHDVFNRELEDFFNIKSSSVTTMVHYLERAGYIRKEAVAEDKRLKKLIITDKTREIETWLCGFIDNYIVSTFTGFSQEEMEVFEKLVEKMLPNLPH